MAENIQVVTFEGGEIALHGAGRQSREAVLALPLSRFVAKVMCIRADSPGEEVVLGALSPFPDEPLSVSCETEAETVEGRRVLAIALPESASEDVAEALDAARVGVERVDSLALGALRVICAGFSGPGRRLVVFAEEEDTVVAVFDGMSLCSLRTVPSSADLGREAMFSLMEAEENAGPAPLAECMAADGVDAEVLGRFGAPVRSFVPPSREDILSSVAERSSEEGAANALPASWREVLLESRFKSKMKTWLVAAAAVWVLVMAVLFGVPAAYGFMTDRMKSLSKEHSRKYREVSEMRDKVRLVQKYSDHSRGALEILKAVGDRLPAGIELNSWSFRRSEGAKFSGEADEPSAVYELKEALSAIAFEDSEGSGRLFGTVVLTGPSAGKGGKQRFDIECKFAGEDEP